MNTTTTVQRLTRDQATAITAYTGITTMSFSDFRDEVSKKIPGITTLGFVSSADRIKDLYKKEFDDTLKSLTFSQIAHLSVVTGNVTLFPTLTQEFRDLIYDQTGHTCAENIGKEEHKVIEKAYGRPLLDALCYTEGASATSEFLVDNPKIVDPRQKMS